MDDVSCKIWLRTKGSYHPFGCSPYTVMTKVYIKLCTLRERKVFGLIGPNWMFVHLYGSLFSCGFWLMVLRLSHHVLSLLSHWDLYYRQFLQQGLSPLWSNFLLLLAGLSLRFSSEICSFTLWVLPLWFILYLWAEIDLRILFIYVSTSFSTTYLMIFLSVSLCIFLRCLPHDFLSINI